VLKEIHIREADILNAIKYKIKSQCPIVPGVPMMTTFPYVSLAGQSLGDISKWRSNVVRVNVQLSDERPKVPEIRLSQNSGNYIYTIQEGWIKLLFEYLPIE